MVVVSQFTSLHRQVINVIVYYALRRTQVGMKLFDISNIVIMSFVRELLFLRIWKVMSPTQSYYYTIGETLLQRRTTYKFQ